MNALLATPRAETVLARIKSIKAHEVLIFFVLLVLLALCLLVALPRDEPAGGTDFADAAGVNTQAPG